MHYIHYAIKWIKTYFNSINYQFFKSMVKIVKLFLSKNVYFQSFSNKNYNVKNFHPEYSEGIQTHSLQVASLVPLDRDSRPCCYSFCNWNLSSSSFPSKLLGVVVVVGSIDFLIELIRVDRDDNFQSLANWWLAIANSLNEATRVHLLIDLSFSTNDFDQLYSWPTLFTLFYSIQLISWHET